MRSMLKSSTTSNRAVETVEPLSKALRLPIRHGFLKKEVTKVITDCERHDFKTILVCWEHKMLAKLSHCLGISHQLLWGLNPYKSQDKHCFDATWLIDSVHSHQRLRVYRQFRINARDDIDYPFPPNLEVFASVSM